jgi:hypothetical protein
VLYDAADGQARVLGGGFIKRTLGAGKHMREGTAELLAARD